MFVRPVLLHCYCSELCKVRAIASAEIHVQVDDVRD